MGTKRVLVGEIGRPHGVRGLVKLRSFTEDPAAIEAYAPLTDEAGQRRFAIEFVADGLARIEGVADRDAAARLTGTRLYVERDRLPPTEDPEEFYLADLIGMQAVTRDGTALGRVRAVEDHGAGSFLVLDGGPKEMMIPFTRAAVPVVDTAANRVVVVPPEETAVAPDEGGGAAA